ncbi:MAG TPA: beta galactosidase jelly roll domain-containing protein [Streptosporangiaceae bacterium]|nr:beta galactosidase jelly roll domain-containing protein [Streptosporangiaceae bacterium]
MQLCYGYESTIGKDTDSLFDVPWWWRTTFTASPSSSTYETLIVNGVIGTANVWLNGTQIATSATVTGAYTRFTFPVTSHVVAGTNAVAIDRTVTSYLTGSSAAEKNGTRAFKINNVPLVIRGGGWSPDIFLHYSAGNTAEQVALMKNMGVNAIRLEGHIMPNDWFQQMDAAGILVNSGYQCCDAWDVLSNNMQTAADLAIMKNSALTIGENTRNDPSVFSFQWSDDQPTGNQEKVTAQGFAAAGFDDPLIASAEYNPGPYLGASGEKEGPYNWVPPNYWYDTTHYDTSDSTETNAGGAWGYDSEQSAGNTVPTMYSLDRFMSPTELTELWVSGDTKYNQYHTDYEPRCSTGYDFGTLCEFDAALEAQYGTPTSLAQYVEDAQAQEYQDTQAQFEAYINNANNTPLPSTGTIYWQMNKGWPSLLWNLYNFDGDQSGAYYGVQEANLSVHAIYALSNGTVTLDNLTGQTQSGLSVTAKVYNLAGAVTNSQTASGISLASQQVKNKVLTPAVPAPTKPPTKAQVYFVELTLSHNGAVLDRNVYWLSTQANQVNWSATLDQSAATMTQYANLQPLHTLPTATVSVTATTTQQAGPDGADLATTVKITNTSSGTTPAFLTRADIVQGTASGGVLPGDPELPSSIWNANDITLWPGESQTLTVTYDSADLNGATPVVNVSGWNVGTVDVAAPVP